MLQVYWFQRRKSLPVKYKKRFMESELDAKCFSDQKSAQLYDSYINWCELYAWRKELPYCYFISSHISLYRPGDWKLRKNWASNYLYAA